MNRDGFVDGEAGGQRSYYLQEVFQGNPVHSEDEHNHL